MARGYIAKLLGNRAMTRFLQQNYLDFLSEFRTIVDAASLDEGGKGLGKEFLAKTWSTSTII